MVKRVLSLLLALMMIFSITSIPGFANTEAEKQVLLKFYLEGEDGGGNPTLTQTTTAMPGDFVQAVVSAENFPALVALNAVVSYDPSKVELVSFVDGSKVTKDGDIGGTEVTTGSCGLKFDEIVDEEAMDYENFSVIDNAQLPEIITSGNYVGAAIYKQTPGLVEGEKKIFRIRFKIAENALGDSGITFATSELGAGKYNELYPNGVRVNSKVASGEDANECTKVVSKLTITGKPLGIPEIELTDRIVSWNAVDDAEGYNVSVVAKKFDEVIYNETIELGNVTSFEIKEELVKVGDVAVKVQAVASDAASEFSAEKTATFTQKLDAPENVEWDDDVLVWNAVENATAYEIAFKKGTDAPEIVTVDAPATSKEFALEAPVTGVNEYSATVKAIGNKYYEASETATSPVKKLAGKVAAPTLPKWDGYKATWNESADAENVEGYEVSLYKGSALVETVTVTANSANLEEYIKGAPGKYMFYVKALGKETAECEYKNSDSVYSGELVEEAVLEKIDGIEWNERILTWNDANTATSEYQIQLYKIVENMDDDLVGTYTTTEKTFDFNGIIEVGAFKAVIVAKGDGVIYKDSEAAESAVKTFAERLTAPTGLSWVKEEVDGELVIKAKWGAVDNAKGYKVKLYYKGVEIVRAAGSVAEGVTEYDFTADIIFDENYQFAVQAYRDDAEYSSSEYSDKSADYTLTADKVGTVSVKAYKNFENGVASEELSEVAGGQEFYAVINIAGTKNLSAITVPFKFDPSYVKVADVNGVPVTDCVLAEAAIKKGESGIVLGQLFRELEFAPVANDVYATVDNTNGIVKFSGYAMEDKEITDVTAVAIKLVAVTPGTTDLTFANVEDSVYDKASYGGISMANADGHVFAGTVSELIGLTITKGTLPKMAAPVIEDKVVTWEKLGGNAVVGYTVKLYKNGEVINEVTVDAQESSYNMSEFIGSAGTYTATVTALGDGVSADNGLESDPSEEYVIRSSKRRNPSGGGTVVVVPEKPELTDVEGHWAEEAIRELVEEGIILGYGDNTFRPDWGITRAEFTKLMVEALGAGKETVTDDEYVYADTENHWAKNYVAIGTKYGIVNGIGDNLFDPDTIITREQIAAIIWRIAGKQEVAEENSFIDSDEVTAYAAEAVEYVNAEKIMIGFEDNSFGPTQQTNRAQAATVVSRLLKADFFKKNNITK